ncbi:MAG: SLC13 family permease, partial [Candidatus Eiseniibacteriota bacterium]
LHQEADAPVPKAAARLLAEADSGDTKGEQAAPRRSAPAIVEAVVRADARIAGRSAASFRLRTRFGVTLLGVAHEGRTFREQVRTRVIAPGDVLLLAGPRAALNHVVEWLGAIPINEASVAPAKAWRIVVALGLFAAAVAAASTGWLSFTVAIGIAVAGYAATGLVPAREFYDQIDWPVVVMLACLLPLGTAFENVGGTALIANTVLDVTHGQPAAVTLALVMVVTMMLSNVLNNVATMVIAGPLAVAIALKLGVSADSFLMGAAVATSSAFLTPIGHKNNTLIMGPGGYAFGDYWRVGLPLQVIVLVVAIPLILVVWPL